MSKCAPLRLAIRLVVALTLLQIFTTRYLIINLCVCGRIGELESMAAQFKVVVVFFVVAAAAAVFAFISLALC